MSNEAEQRKRYMSYLSAHERWSSALYEPGDAVAQDYAMERAWLSYLEVGGSRFDALHY